MSRLKCAVCASCWTRFAAAARARAAACARAAAVLLEVVDVVAFVVEVAAGLAVVFEGEGVVEVVDCAEPTPAPKDATSKNTPLTVAAP
jgi:hypothetical protein